MAGKTSAGWRVLHRRSHTSAESDEICFDVCTRLPGGGGLTTPAAIHRRPLETRDWGQIGTVRFVAESTGCGQRKYTKIMGNRPRRLPNEALRPPKAAREASRAAQGPLRALRGGFGVVSRLPLGRKKRGTRKMEIDITLFLGSFLHRFGHFR